MTIKIPAIGSLVLFGILSLGLNTAHAQTIASSTTTSSPVCYILPSSIGYGASDNSTNGEVTSLQNFLVSQGLFSSASIGSGNFGPLTQAAVRKFQAAHSIPATGFVGVLTRASIKTVSCNSTTPVSTSTTTPVTLYSVSPSAGPTGSNITITGSGFTNSNTILFNGNIAARDLPITSSNVIGCTFTAACGASITQTITVPVPTSLAPKCSTGSVCPMYMALASLGQYNVTVQNTNGTSNAATFTITAH